MKFVGPNRCRRYADFGLRVWHIDTIPLAELIDKTPCCSRFALLQLQVGLENRYCDRQRFLLGHEFPPPRRVAEDVGHTMGHQIRYPVIESVVLTVPSFTSFSNSSRIRFALAGVRLIAGLGHGARPSRPLAGFFALCISSVFFCASSRQAGQAVCSRSPLNSGRGIRNNRSQNGHRTVMRSPCSRGFTTSLLPGIGGEGFANILHDAAQLHWVAQRSRYRFWHFSFWVPVHDTDEGPSVLQRLLHRRHAGD